MRAQNQLTQKLEAFISKYYKNLLLKGVLYFTAAFLLFFLTISFAEHFGNFGTTIRTGISGVLYVSMRLFYGSGLLFR